MTCSEVVLSVALRPRLSQRRERGRLGRVMFPAAVPLAARYCWASIVIGKSGGGTPWGGLAKTRNVWARCRRSAVQSRGCSTGMCMTG